MSRQRASRSVFRKMAGKNFMSGNLENKIIEAIRQPGREMLYDLGHKQYRNNALKLQIWTEIGNSVGASKDGCQKIWKNLKAKYRLVLQNKKGRSGSAAKKTKPHTEWLLQELEFLKKFVEDGEPTTTNFIESQVRSPSPFQGLFDEMASEISVSDPSLSTSTSTSAESSTPQPTTRPLKARKALEECEANVATYLKRLERFEEQLSAPTQELDRFTLLVDEELKKVPEAKKKIIKMQILKIIYEAQEE